MVDYNKMAEVLGDFANVLQRKFDETESAGYGKGYEGCLKSCVDSLKKQGISKKVIDRMVNEVNLPF